MIILGSNYHIPIRPGEPALLVNPPVYDIQYWAQWSQPSGLLRIGTLLRKKGYKVYLIDCMESDDRRKVPFRHRGGAPRRIGNTTAWESHYGISLEGFDKKLSQLSESPQKIFVTSIMTYWWPSTRDTVDILRRRFPMSEIVVGGIYPTLCPEHAEEHIGRGTTIIVGEIPEASDLPPDLSLYAKMPPYAIVTTSRGCPFNCAYCAQRAINGEGIRQREPEDVVEEVADKVRLGVREFAFYEDYLLFKAESHLRKILNLLIERDLKVRIYAPEGMDPRLLYQDLVNDMKKAGWQKIHLGFESVYSDVRLGWDRTNHTTNESFETALEMCKKAGFKLRSPEVNAFVLYGVPGEKIENVVDTILYVAHRVGSIIPMLFTPVPGSTLYEKMKGSFAEKGLGLEDLNGRLLPFAEYNGYQASDYMDLQRLMFVLNHAVQGRSLDLLDDSRTNSLVRERLLILAKSAASLRAGIRPVEI
jgi:hypothetical protein